MRMEPLPSSVGDEPTWNRLTQTIWPTAGLEPSDLQADSNHQTCRLTWTSWHTGWLEPSDLQTDLIWPTGWLDLTYRLTQTIWPTGWLKPSDRQADLIWPTCWLKPSDLQADWNHQTYMLTWTNWPTCHHKSLPSIQLELWLVNTVSVTWSASSGFRPTPHPTLHHHQGCEGLFLIS